MTPQQMRELARQHEERAGWTAEGESGVKWFRDTAAALRTAAGQLEAVQTWADHADPVYADLSGLYAILTADTAPRKASVVDATLEASRLQLEAEESAETAPQEKATVGPRSIPGVRDMTPGSVFTAMHKDPGECGGVEHRWFVFWSKGYGNAVYNDEGQRWSADSIDRATVRNYTAPQEGRHE